MENSILVTGCAGFIGFHITKRLINDGTPVVGLDNFNTYYSQRLKRDRLDILNRSDNFTFHKIDLANREAVANLFQQMKPSCVIHLAGQPGVRFSIDNPWAYLDSNLAGFLSVLEACRHNNVGHLIYASSSSVYGANTKRPFSVEDSVDHPISLYAATKKANELMAHTYSHLYDLPTTGLRFFTVYGPWGRPDMAIMKFSEAILSGKTIDLYNYGKMQRDFTYVDDVVEPLKRLVECPPSANNHWQNESPTPATSSAPWRVYNIGNSSPTELLYVVELLEKYLGKKAERNLLPIQPGDVLATFADVGAIEKDIGFKPSTSIEEGVSKFVDWYLEYYQSNQTMSLKKAA